MKKTYFFMMVIFMTILSSCSKDSEISDFDFTAAAQGELIATVDGREFKATTQDAMFYEGDLYITAMDLSTGEMISITVASPEESTFDLGSNRISITSASYTTMEKSSYFSIHPDAGGKITISELDMDNKTVSGTFNFKGIKLRMDASYDEVIEITSGAFNKIPFYIPEELTNSGTAKINGNPLTFDTVYAYEAFSNFKVNMHASSNDGLLLFEIPMDITAGTYDLTGGTWSASYSIGGDEYYPSSGTLNITNHDTEIGLLEGSFECMVENSSPSNGINSYNFTEGEFSIYYYAQ